MASSAAQLQKKKWTKGDFFISTDTSLIPLALVNAMFASEAMYWARPLPEEDLRIAIDSSLCFGLYHNNSDKESSSPSSSPPLVGFARLVTDFVLVSFLTDVVVDAAYQGKGLGEWILQCVQECVNSMPHLRRTMLLAMEGRGVAFYERVFGTKVFGSGGDDHGLAVLSRPGPALQN